MPFSDLLSPPLRYCRLHLTVCFFSVLEKISVSISISSCSRMPSHSSLISSLVSSFRVGVSWYLTSGEKSSSTFSTFFCFQLCLKFSSHWWMSSGITVLFWVQGLHNLNHSFKVFGIGSGEPDFVHATGSNTRGSQKQWRNLGTP